MTNIAPKEVFDIFHEINQVPRPSKHEEKIIAWLKQFAEKHSIWHTTDEAGNVIMRVPATKGYEDHPGIILQAHMDMVCEKNSDVDHDFMTDPIQTWVDGDWLKAKGTTLGADNGIGISLALAAITTEGIAHPEVECLFTVDEETGLTGADRLGHGLLNGKQLINLDSEDDGEIFIGCAGGVDTLANLYYTTEEAPKGWFAAKLTIRGFKGGHSGDDINKGRANANKVLVRFLFALSKKTDWRLCSFTGGNLRNAIAREAEATIMVPMAYKEQLRVDWNLYIAQVEESYKDTEGQQVLSLESTETQPVVAHDIATKLIQTLYACPHGVYAMSKDMPGLVETSTNMASVKMKKNDRGTYFEINTSQRSSIEAHKHSLKNMVECALALSGAECTHGDGYPGWKPNTQSELLKITQSAYQEVTGKQAAIKAIHAGLECGLFLEKYPYLDMVSIGPQMTGVHSPMEQLSISSTQRTWEWLKTILAKL